MPSAPPRNSMSTAIKAFCSAATASPRAPRVRPDVEVLTDVLVEVLVDVLVEVPTVATRPGAGTAKDSEVHTRTVPTTDITARYRPALLGP